MNIRKFVTRSASMLALAGMLVFGLGSAQAAQIPYVPGQPLDSPNTPGFNLYTNVPNGVGNEADFVKLRKSNGDPKVAGSVSIFTDPVSATCNVGEKFDVRTYVHNGADADHNNNGSGSAVAHNVKVAMQAPLGVTGKQFKFASTISASNAASVSDNGTLNCANNVRLKLVPKTVHVYSDQYGWKAGSDNAVNGSMTIGSRVAGSGDVWGCWADRVRVVYTVEVIEAPVVSKAVCDVLTLRVIDNRRVSARITASAQNATITGYTIDWGDGSKTNEQEAEHTYAKEGSYTIKGSASVRHADGKTETVTGPACEKKVTFEKDNCPLPGKEHLPVDSPECKEVPKELPKTGAGSIAGIFAATSFAGSIAHRVVYSRRRK